MTKKILIINGPNLNMLGAREPEIYGSDTLEDIKTLCEREGKKTGIKVDFRQSNAESDIISWVQDATKEKFAGIIINAAGFTHTSIAIMDALLGTKMPVIEVHLSNIFRREEFRHKSYISPASKGIICGFGANSYTLAIQAMSEII